MTKIKVPIFLRLRPKAFAFFFPQVLNIDFVVQWYFKMLREECIEWSYPFFFFFLSLSGLLHTVFFGYTLWLENTVYTDIEKSIFGSLFCIIILFIFLFNSFSVNCRDIFFCDLFFFFFFVNNGMIFHLCLIIFPARYREIFSL